MSVCDTCPVPGHCFRYVMIGGGSFGSEANTIEEAEAFMRASVENTFGPPMPFHPLFRRSDGIWLWWCPNLNARTGRCDDYENRPYCCSSYEPASDRLCVLHEEAE